MIKRFTKTDPSLLIFYINTYKSLWLRDDPVNRLKQLQKKSRRGNLDQFGRRWRGQKQRRASAAVHRNLFMRISFTGTGGG